jgi:uncharacterized membrane protein YphA (DoxX/SURF4 family)
MKIYKITYRITTGLVVAIMAFTSYAYLSKAPQLMATIKQAGMPYYFMFMLGIAKILGILALLFSKWTRLKEWAYAGFTFTLVGAIWVHYSSDTSAVSAILFLVILGISYICWKKMNEFLVNVGNMPSAQDKDRSG